jgi:hypothetical protein
LKSITPNGHAPTHSPQPIQTSLSIKMTFILSIEREMAPTGHAAKQGASAHCLHVMGTLKGNVYLPSMNVIILMRDLPGFITASFANEHATSQLLHPIHFFDRIFSCFGIVVLTFQQRVL